MASYIIKRDGRKENFNKQKIFNAIKKAFIAEDKMLNKAGVKTIRRITKDLEKIILEREDEFTVEEIQNLVEQKLMQSNRKDVAKAYIIYREQRNQDRERNSSLIKNIKLKLDATDVQNQNANVDEYSFGGRAGEARDEILKNYALNYLISDKSKNNHLNNEIYIHDLSSYALGDHNCLSIPFDDILAKGFNTRQTDVRPANSINTAFQLLAVIFQLQSLQQFGRSRSNSY